MIREHLKRQGALRREVVLGAQGLVGLLQQIDNVGAKSGALALLELDLKVRGLDSLKLSARKTIQQIQSVPRPDVEVISFESGLEGLGALLLPADPEKVDAHQAHGIPVPGVDLESLPRKLHRFLIEADGHG